MSRLREEYSDDKKLYEIAGKRSCTGCGACASVCPVGCIQMVENKEGFFYPVIDHTRCIGCKKCYKVCPNEPEDDEDVVAVLAGYSHNRDIRLTSSSGGVFTHLAEEILKRNGVVFGVEMQESQAVVCAVESMEEIQKLRGSKYVQCQVRNAYRQAEKYLKEGRWVLFSGTPCQIAGLYRVLKKEYVRLITLDFVCHGISSPRVLQKYLKEQGNGKRTSEIVFRDKTEGWNKFSIKVKWEDDTVSRASLEKDPYLQSFLKNLNLRSSCFSCKFRKIHRKSDITLGDLWGADEVIDGWTEDLGYSLILIQSKKGKELLESIKEKIVAVPVELSQVMLYNASLTTSPWDEYSRDVFFKNLAKHDLQHCISKAEKNGIKKKAGRKIWKICKREM